MDTVLLYLLTLLIPQAITSVKTETTEKFQIVVTEKLAQNDTIAKLVDQQTEVIKKLLDQKQSYEYPVVTKKEAEVKDDLKIEKERESIEELKRRCQHFFKLNNEQKTQERVDNFGQVETTQESFGPLQRPQFLQVKTQAQQPRLPFPPVRPQLNSNKLLNNEQIQGVIEKNVQKIQNASVQEKSEQVIYQKIDAQNPIASQNIKYIKLEPIFWQKTILGDGRIVYYWHKSLPNVPLYSLPQNYEQIPKDLDVTRNAENNFKQNYEGESSEVNEKTPDYDIKYPDTKESLYAHRLKFVLPMPYTNFDAPTIFPGQFDAFAYYPRNLQPSFVNVRVPYQPNFHMLRTLTVPNDLKNQKK